MSWMLRIEVHVASTFVLQLIILTRIIWFDAKMRNFRLARNYLWNSQVSDLFFDKGHIMSIADKSTLLYRHNMWLTNKILRYRRIVRFKRQNAKISACSLRSLVIIYELFQVSTLLIRLAISWVLRTEIHVASTFD